MSHLRQGAESAETGPPPRQVDAVPAEQDTTALSALARDARTASDLLASLWNRVEALGGAAYDAGWKYPIATLLSEAEHLNNWADKLDAIVSD
jgi:hypothetical protein